MMSASGDVETGPKKKITVSPELCDFPDLDGEFDNSVLSLDSFDSSPVKQDPGPVTHLQLPPPSTATLPSSQPYLAPPPGPARLPAITEENGTGKRTPPAAVVHSPPATTAASSAAVLEVTGPEQEPDLSDFNAGRRLSQRRISAGGRFDPEDGLKLTEFPKGFVSVAEYDYPNGHQLGSHIVQTYKDSWRCRFSESNTYSITPTELRPLRITEAQYRKAMAPLQKIPKIKYHFWVYNLWTVLCLCVVMFFALFGLGMGLWIGAGRSSGAGIALFFMLGLILVAGILMAWVFITDNLDSQGAILMGQVNEKLTEHHVITGLVDQGPGSCHTLYLAFAFFDIDQCLEQIIQDLSRPIQVDSRSRVSKILSKLLKRRQGSTGDSLTISDTEFIIPSGEITESQRQSLARDIFYRHIDAYVSKLFKAQLEIPVRYRHAQKSQCICQFVQQEYFNMPEEIQTRY